jgi:hypothetical protein
MAGRVPRGASLRENLFHRNALCRHASQTALPFMQAAAIFFRQRVIIRECRGNSRATGSASLLVDEPTDPRTVNP